MTKHNQRQAVYAATLNVLAEHGINFDDGQSPTVLDIIAQKSDLRKEIIAVVTAGFVAGEIELSPEATAKFDTETKLRTYASGLVNNWHRKDRRLNGDAKYEAKNPGSRAGAGDDQLKALKAIRAAKADDAEAVKVIDAAIAKRQTEIKATKVVTLTDEQIAAIPAELREKLGL